MNLMLDSDCGTLASLQNFVRSLLLGKVSMMIAVVVLVPRAVQFSDV